jgi:hypothetical protein
LIELALRQGRGECVVVGISWGSLP